MQLLPLLLLFGFSFLSALPNIFSSTPIPDPRYSFTATSRYNVERRTGGLGVTYHVNAGEFMGHPIIGAELAREGETIKGGEGSEGEDEDDGTGKEGSGGEEDKERRRKERKERKEKKRQEKEKRKRGAALAKFESTVERVYTQEMYGQCQRGIDRKERAKEVEMGLFGFGTDWDKVKKIEAEVLESCEELKRLGVIR
jgi:DnaJ family protein B protein 12